MQGAVLAGNGGEGKRLRVAGRRRLEPVALASAPFGFHGKAGCRMATP